jgi:non-specific serine/threonine protein kinase
MAEEAVSKKLSAAIYSLKRVPMAAQPGIYRLRARTHPVDFLLHRVPKLVEDGFEIYGEEQLKSARVNRQKPTISFSVSSEIDWFDVQAIINFGELQVSLKDIRKALKKRERFIKLADGSIGEIPEEWLD